MSRMIPVSEKYPELLKFWDYDKNDETPDNVPYRTTKKYYWKCELGHSIYTIPKTKAEYIKGCPYCSGRKVLKGFNDLWTTNPEIAKMLKNPEDGYKVTLGSHKKLDWICPFCGKDCKNKEVNMVRIRGKVPCKYCGDGVSYPEKVFISLFDYLGVNYIYQLYKKQLQYNWCDKYKYDFYIEDYSLIIEVQGGFHYGKEYKHKNARSFQEVIAIDNLKREIALNNGIKNYLLIDCQNSHFNYIKESILSSDLSKILNIDLSKIDWDKIKNNIIGSYMVNVCEYFNQNSEMTLLDISKHFSKNQNTIANYLINGTKIGLCNYDASQHKKLACKHYHYKKSVKCITTGEIFESARQAGFYYNIKSSNITSCCTGKLKHAGKLPNGIGLQWEYV